MNLEHIVSLEQIRAVNREYGGALRSDAEIETALFLGKGKNVFRKIAYLLRAILVGHPFSDGNKRTALMVALLLLESCGIRLDGKKKEMLVYEMVKIAKENIRDIKRIERLVRYVVSGN